MVNDNEHLLQQLHNSQIRHIIEISYLEIHFAHTICACTSIQLKANQSWVETQILNYGAVLIRGFQVNDAPEFERAIKSLQLNLNDSYRGTSPRSVFPGTQFCFSAADAPVNYPIAQHCEMSFLKSPPKQLYFGCLQESKSGGGETALCDFRAVAQQ